MTIRILHKDCGGLLFNYAERPRIGEVIKSNLATLPDGTSPTPFTDFSIVCQRCGQKINSLQFIEVEGGLA